MNRDPRGMTEAGLRDVMVKGGVSPKELQRFDEVFSRRTFLGLAGAGGMTAFLKGFGAGPGAVLEGLCGPEKKG